jgi:hypothetical protein
MSFEPVAGPVPVPPEPPRRRFSRIPRAALTGGLVVGLALGGAGIAFAATSSTSTPSTTAPPSTAKPGPGPRGFGGGFNGMAGPGAVNGLGAVVHGQFTERTKTGTYQTVEIQVGKVGSVSATSITVTSTDGYSHTYAVVASTVVDAQRAGISSVAKGDQVRIAATTVSGKDTATNIADSTKVGASRNGFGFGPRGRRGPGGAPGAPKAPGAPAAPGSSAGTTAD